MTVLEPAVWGGQSCPQPPFQAASVLQPEANPA